MNSPSPSLSPFALDPRLQADTHAVADLALSRLLLMDDRRWLWAILVPRRVGAAELTDLAQTERAELAEEAAHVAAALRRIAGMEKTNVATLGNVVRQFHLHVIARCEGDPNWPGPVWGYGAREPYAAGEAQALAAALREALA